MLCPQYAAKFSHNDAWKMDRPHFHEDIEILLSLTAGGDYFVGRELYPIQEGSLFVFPEATLHKSNTQSAYQRYVLHISPDTLRQFSTAQSNFYEFAQDIRYCARHLDKKEMNKAAAKFRALIESPDNGPCGDIRKHIILLELLTAAFTLFNTQSVAPQESSPELQRIQPIMEYIQRHLTEPLSLDRLSAVFFINKYHMCHTFKSATGFSVMEYIINCRVLKARELLRQGLRVQEVGERVGFRNNAHFIRTFGNLTGTSPKRYAKEYLAGEQVSTRV